ncbi:mediator complex, subunit Med20 [Phlyctochytrium arcticum]|nr:mediator complex, subunit Med20 [Phlyctochytrium arcticum]
MGVTCVLYLPSASSTTLEHIDGRLKEDFTFDELEVPWRVTCRAYRDQVALRQESTGSNGSALHTPKVQYVLSMGHAKQYYSMIATMGARRQQENGLARKTETGVVVGVDPSFIEILGKMKNLWALRHEVTIEGVVYQRGRHIIRVGTMQMGGEAIKGLFVQSENIEAGQPTRQTWTELRKLLRGSLEGLPGIVDAELNASLLGKSARKATSATADGGFSGLADMVLAADSPSKTRKRYAVPSVA